MTFSSNHRNCAKILANKMNRYRTHHCGELRSQNLGQQVKLSGWIRRRRDHGQVLFIDLWDNYGTTQCVFSDNQELVEQVSRLSLETVISVTGIVNARSSENINAKIGTGEIEVQVEALEVLSSAETLPFPVNQEVDLPEWMRLTYRFLDLRRDEMHNNILLRSRVIAELRKLMNARGFVEFQTPILTASSPEGARDFVVPSRLHPGHCYALPQAPQQFKQLLMISGFDRYFQIAPCFRDEDARADRSPGEFYQLDIEMSFVEQEDVFQTMEPVLYELFKTFSDWKISPTPFRRIPYTQAMLEYGCDKPDLRNPLIIKDVSDIFADSGFSIFANAVKTGAKVRAIPAPGTADRPRSFFDSMIEFAQSHGAKGLAYISFTAEGAKSPIAKFLNESQLAELKTRLGLKEGDSVFFACDRELTAAKLAGIVRNKLGADLGLIDQQAYEFCWVVDFPYFEYDEENKKLEFSHNPFSMPQGGLDALLAAKTLEEQLAIKAYQYDIVCNGIELSSGAIRNHLPELMYQAFGMVGYSREDVDAKFGGMIKAFKFGAPPHGGFAPGIDRIVMLLANSQNIREVIAFPMNQQGQDLLMNAPSPLTPQQLRELHIKLDIKTKQ